MAAAAQSDDPAAPDLTADPDLCTPTSVLYEIDYKNHTRLKAILEDARNAANNDSHLWRIEKADTPVSYLYGTVHVVDPAFQILPRPVKDAIDVSRVVITEAERASPTSLSRMMANAAPLIAATNRDLAKVLDDDEIAIVEKALARAGYPAQLALALRPWAATMFLTESQCQDAFRKHGLKSIDEHVFDRAEAFGKKIVGLETMLEQYTALAAIPDNAQIAWLKASIALYHRVDDISATITELYRFGRLEAVWPLTREMAPDAGLDDATLKSLHHALVEKRNVKMLARAMPFFEAGSAFMAVGAMHETGPEGLVALLRQKGFTVTAIDLAPLSE